MQLFKVYPLTDERVKEVALLHLNTTNRGEVTCLYTHYNIEYNFFCNEGDEEWCDNYVICDYDKEYLKMNIKYGDTISYKGFIGEVVSVTDNKVTVHYGGDALHYCVEEYDITDNNIIVINTNEGV